MAFVVKVSNIDVMTTYSQNTKEAVSKQDSLFLYY